MQVAYVRELNFPSVQKTMQDFIAFVNRDASPTDEELVALSSMPIFSSVVNKLQSWSGKVDELPEFEVLIDSINDYTDSLNEIMGPHYEH